MKVAQVPGTALPVTASPDAPPEGTCPHCGAGVRLRERTLMDGKLIYFWRHVRNSRRRCPESKRPFG